MPGFLMSLHRICLGWDVTAVTVRHLGNKTSPCFVSTNREADEWLPGLCLVLPILFTQWVFLFGTTVNFPMGFVWQQVIVKNAVCHFSSFSYLSSPHLFASLFHSNLLPPSLCLSLSTLFDIALLLLYADTHSKSSHAMPYLADPRTPEAICQLQLVSRVHCAVVTQNLTCWSVYVCSLMIDTTFQLKQIADINQATEEAFTNWSIQELSE